MISGDNPNGEMVVYVGDDGKSQIQARLQDENMWLTQVQLAQVFQTTRQNIGQHIKNIYEEKELDPSATIKKFFIVQIEGDREVSRNIEQQHLEESKAVRKKAEVKNVRPERKVKADLEALDD
jgi:virulence protein-like protein